VPLFFSYLAHSWSRSFPRPKTFLSPFIVFLRLELFKAHSARFRSSPLPPILSDYYPAVVFSRCSTVCGADSVGWTHPLPAYPPPFFTDPVSFFFLPAHGTSRPPSELTPRANHFFSIGANNSPNPPRCTTSNLPTPSRLRWMYLTT